MSVKTPERLPSPCCGFSEAPVNKRKEPDQSFFKAEYHFPRIDRDLYDEDVYWLRLAIAIYPSFRWRELRTSRMLHLSCRGRVVFKPCGAFGDVCT